MNENNNSSIGKILTQPTKALRISSSGRFAPQEMVLPAETYVVFGGKVTRVVDGSLSPELQGVNLHYGVAYDSFSRTPAGPVAVPEAAFKAATLPPTKVKLVDLKL